MKRIHFTIAKHIWEKLPQETQAQLGNTREQTIGYLLSTQSHKAVLGETVNVLNAIMYLAPGESVLPGFNACSNMTIECFLHCIAWTGQLGMPDGIKAQAKRLLFMLSDLEAFTSRLRYEITLLQKRADKKGMLLGVRLNGTSDIPWESRKYNHLLQDLISSFPEARFYDYTKIPGRCFNGYRANHGLESYHLTFSWSGDNQRAIELIDSDVNVAVPFAAELPKTFIGRDVIDGDAHDLCFLDPVGVIRGLKYKRSRDVKNGGSMKVESAPNFVVQ